MEKPIHILQQYWKHGQFRPMQEDIIASVLSGKDTLALLPTGGGKSICFQIPALAMEGICIVITPLIALMKDQVSQLKRRGIEAVAIHAGMSRSEIDVLLNNCIYGSIKFLYVSPERLQTELFIARVKQMKVNLIAVDEAHCISQWGYDFRPPYLQIALLRELVKDVPIIALTATATVEVRNDIIDKLAFRKDYGVFQKSFARENLSFVVRKAENKEKKLLDILQKVKGSAIVYVRSRKGTQEIAAFLMKNNISASFYHAGLDFNDRAKRQDDWIQDKVRVMVATNAFGMGIDKSDVRTVVHIDLPENIESYYQEAGRAGRDGLRSYAAILFHDADVVNLKLKVAQSQPEPAFLKTIYQSLANYFQLAVGSSAGESYDFELQAFCDRFKYHSPDVYAALRKLEEEGLILFNESFYRPSQLRICFDKGALYQFQVANAIFDPMIKMLLRLYGGELFTEFVIISESDLAKAMKMKYSELVKALLHLQQLGVVEYQPVKDKPQVTFVLARQDADHLPLNYARLAARKKLIEDKMNSMVSYVSSDHQCRMQVMQEYFNEDTFKTCGICDVCINKRKSESGEGFDDIKQEVLTVIRMKSVTVEQLEDEIAPRDHELFVDAVRELVDDGIVKYDDGWKLLLTKTI
ncbi:MAG TPA: ATP-dependent DNA helicase RecQ [Chryseolinea sp.]|nr:ATP-dependent DNA helicase RecQ [Chryseolinea sp.]